MTAKWIRRVSCMVVVAALGVGVMSSAFGATFREEQFDKCVRGPGGYGSPRDHYAICCANWGDGWVDIYDDKGNWVGGYCRGLEGSDLTNGALEPTAPTPTPRPQSTTVGDTSGTYTQPTPTSTPVRTTTTSGTVAR